MKNVVIFYDHLEYFTIIWYNLWPFGIVCCHLVHFLRFGMFGPKNLATLVKIHLPKKVSFKIVPFSFNIRAAQWLREKVNRKLLT
jgi:hypothetical protein